MCAHDGKWPQHFFTLFLDLSAGTEAEFSEGGGLSRLYSGWATREKLGMKGL